MKLLLLDGTNALMRAFMATEKASMSSHGVSTAALHVFINTLSRYVKEVKPTHLMVAWDSPGKKKKTELDSTYKANRNQEEHPLSQTRKSDAFVLAKTFCSLAGIQQVRRSGYEADEIIAHYWRVYRNQAKIVIVSSDKDYFQLLLDDTTQMRFTKAGDPIDLWDTERVEKHFGCPIDWVVPVMALMGDESDNVTGVKGVGIKTAVKLLEKTGGIIDEIEDSRFLDDKNHILNNIKLVDLRNVSIDEMPDIEVFSPTKEDSVLFDQYVLFLELFEMHITLEKVRRRNLW